MNFIEELFNNMDQIRESTRTLMNFSKDAFICVMCTTLDEYAARHDLDSVDMAALIYEMVEDVNEAEGPMKVF